MQYVLHLWQNTIVFELAMTDLLELDVGISLFLSGGGIIIFQVILSTIIFLIDIVFKNRTLCVYGALKKMTHY